jgi:phage host-nuclease inhibitor protein Gam
MDEYFEDELEITGGFTVDTDGKADWCIERIAEIRAEIERFNTVTNERIEALRDRQERYVAGKQSNIEYFEGQLRAYMEHLDITPTKAGSRIYNLPSGKLTLKPESPEFAIDKTALVGWLKAAGKTDFVKVEELPMWGELKKACTVTDGKVITAEGEVVDGVAVEMKPAKLEVKI